MFSMNSIFYLFILRLQEHTLLKFHLHIPSKLTSPVSTVLVRYVISMLFICGCYLHLSPKLLKFYWSEEHIVLNFWLPRFYVSYV